MSSEEHEDPESYRGNEQSAISTEEDDDLNPITRVPTKQISRRLSDAVAKDVAPMDTDFHDWLAKAWSQMRPDFIFDHFDWTSFKVTSRTWVHLWILLLLNFIHPSLKWLGSATYVGIMIAVIAPVGGESVIAQAIQCLAQLLCITIAFLGHTIIMAINTHLRGDLTQEQVLQRFIDEGRCQPGDPKCLPLQLLKGDYVSNHTNVVLAFGYILTMGVINVLAVTPPLDLFLRVPHITGMICGTIMIIYSNHVPYFSPWFVGKLVYLPIFVCISSAMVLACIWFPHTSSAKVTAEIEKWLMRATMNNEKLLADSVKFSVKTEQFSDLADKVLNMFHPPAAVWGILAPDMWLLKYELLYSRLDANDVREFSLFLRRIASINSSFSFVYAEFADQRRSAVDAAHNYQANLNSVNEDNIDHHPIQQFLGHRASLLRVPARRLSLQYNTQTGSRGPKIDWLHKRLNTQYTETGFFEKAVLKKARESAASSATFDFDTLDYIWKEILEYHRPVVEAANEGAKVAAKWIHEANRWRATALIIPGFRKARIRKQKEMALEIEEVIKKLEDAYIGSSQRSSEIHQKIEDSENLTDVQKLYTLSQYLVYGYLSDQYLRIVRKFCRWCHYIDISRPKAEILWPTDNSHSAAKRDKVVAYYNALRKPSAPTEPIDDPEVMHQYVPVHHTQRRDPESTPPRNTFHLIGTQLIRVRKFITSEEGIFIIKKSTIPLIPLVVFMDRHTLEWAYGYHVVWATIMTILTTAPKAGDCAYSFSIRLTMTFIGGLIGMVCWYIGSGSGDGNAFGLSATMAVAALPMSYIRHYATLGGPGARIVFCMTVFLVVAVSYSDMQLPSAGTRLTKGWNVFWIRFTTVVCGISCAFALSFFPSPSTTKKALRKQISGVLMAIGDIQATLVNFAVQRHDDPNVHRITSKDTLTLQISSVMRSLAGMQLQVATLKFEPPLTGFWPSHHYQLLHRLLTEMIYLQMVFYAVLNEAPSPNKIMKALNLMGMLDSDLLSGVYSAIYMSSNSIESGEPMPTITPGHLTKDYIMMLRTIVESSELQRQASREEVLWELAKSRSGRVMMMNAHCAEAFYRRMDGVLALIKGLVGERFDFDDRFSKWVDADLY